MAAAAWMAMRRETLILLIALLAAVPVNDAVAQSRDQQMRAVVDSVLASRYYSTPYDTNYVVRPEGRLTLKARRCEVSIYRNQFESNDKKYAETRFAHRLHGHT